jgi:DUSP domain
LKKNLVRNKDYKMVNEFVWNVFYTIYGGGPIIVRKEKDIYSSKVANLNLLESPKQKD